MKLRTCVTAKGEFKYGIHKPNYHVANLREHDCIKSLGICHDGSVHSNRQNFPAEDLYVDNSTWIYEIPNPFPFRGTTYINKAWADQKAKDISLIKLPLPKNISLTDFIKKELCDKNKVSVNDNVKRIFSYLPDPLLLSLATTSTDSNDLVILAQISCEFEYDKSGHLPLGLIYKRDNRNKFQAVIKNKPLFEAVGNNVFLPDNYKKVMVLRPGVQGQSEIVGAVDEKKHAGKKFHVFEYLRQNSYIPWGHYAANMADDAICYLTKDLTVSDMTALRHLYYQRVFVTLAKQLNLSVPLTRKKMSVLEMEKLRKKIIIAVSEDKDRLNCKFSASLWGWNFGFDYAPSLYRLHASHQQVHQQFAMVPETVAATIAGKKSDSVIPSFSCGDMVASFIMDYRAETGNSFFNDYIKAIRNNYRTDGINNAANSLIVYEDAYVMLFVPKAQTSQWELQLMTTGVKNNAFVGNILEADTRTRNALDYAILIAQKIYARMGAAMVTSIEYSKRFFGCFSGKSVIDQRLVYAFMPRLPESPGAFSEAQLRWINGHYPEDFASACRKHLQVIIKTDPKP